jgi:hypothetical protein
MTAQGRWSLGIQSIAADRPIKTISNVRHFPIALVKIPD